MQSRSYPLLLDKPDQSDDNLLRMDCSNLAGRVMCLQLSHLQLIGVSEVATTHSNLAMERLDQKSSFGFCGYLFLR